MTWWFEMHLVIYILINKTINEFGFLKITLIISKTKLIYMYVLFN